MDYHVIKHREATFYMADPKTKEELKYTLENEPQCILDYDPNNIKPDYNLVNMFL